MSGSIDKLTNGILYVAARNGLDMGSTSIDSPSFPNVYDNLVVKHGNSFLAIGIHNSDVTEKGIKSLENAKVTILDNREESIFSLKEKLDHGRENVLFVESELDDLCTSPKLLDTLFQKEKISDCKQYKKFQADIYKESISNPILPNDSQDAVLLDMALNRLSPKRAERLLEECFRVMRKGGKLYIKILLSDEDSKLIVDRLEYIPREDEVVSLLEQCGFYGINFVQRADLPSKVINSIEMRIFVLEAYKGKQGTCFDLGHAVIYKGPWQEVKDDDHHTYRRGERTAVCEKTFKILSNLPYSQDFFFLAPYSNSNKGEAPLFDCNTPGIRDPKVTKGLKVISDTKTNCCQSSQGKSCCC